MSLIYVAIESTPVLDTFITPEVRQAIDELGEVIWQDDLKLMNSAKAGELMARAEVMITGWGQGESTDEYLKQFPSLKLLAHTAGSVAFIASPALYRRGIRVVSGNDIFALSVAEATLAYILAVYREIPYYDDLMRKGGWKSPLYRNEGLFKKKVALLGFGAIARKLLPFLEPFDCEIASYDPFVDENEMSRLSVKKVDFESCFKNYDIVSVHLPLIEDTVGIVGDKELSIMQEGALLVNTSRGPVIDEEALTAHLSSGHIRAALDVYTHEPLAKNHPLRSCPNCLLMPHMGGPTVDRRAAAALSVVEDVKRFLNHEPLLHEITEHHASFMTKNISVEKLMENKHNNA